ncbi:hypothetical protein [Elioraea sp.]|uniref:hypothetical protein n=1 Tax=Elioraea sp. TaxID=2185103 RepID=UPI00307ECBF6
MEGIERDHTRLGQQPAPRARACAGEQGRDRGAVLHGETLTALDLAGLVPILAALALARPRSGAG